MYIASFYYLCQLYQEDPFSQIQEIISAKRTRNMKLMCETMQEFCGELMPNL